MIDDDRSPTPPSQAVNAIRKNTSKELETKINEKEIVPEKTEDSFIQEIVSRSPAKAVTRTEAFVHQPAASNQNSDDSFVDQIISRSPAKPSPRIEDSVDALDALEEALEQVDRAVEKPLAISTTKKTNTKMSSKKASTTAKTGRPTPRPITKPATVPVRPVVKSKKPVFTKAASEQSSVSRPSNMKSRSPPSHARTVSTVAPFTSAKPVTKPRPSSVSFPSSAITPQKAAKSPTRPSFSLPGEAIAARLKAQREARLAKEAESAEAAKEFKAKPVRISKAPKLVVKGTKASAARMSSVKEEGNGSAGGHKRGPSLGVVPKKRISTLPPLPRVKSPSIASADRNSSGNVQPPAVRKPSTAAAASGSKGKEVFARGWVSGEEAKKLKKEKEEAAKRARAEAAERGRLASKEWAEKQKRKMMAEKVRKLATVESIAGVVSG